MPVSLDQDLDLAIGEHLPLDLSELEEQPIHALEAVGVRGR